MKKLLTILCLVLLSTYSYSQKLPPDGPYKSFYENSKLKESGNYKNGKKDGLWEFFNESGQLSSKRNYKDGNRDGLYEVFIDKDKSSLKTLMKAPPNIKPDNLKPVKVIGHMYTKADGSLWGKICYKNDKEVNMSYCNN